VVGGPRRIGVHESMHGQCKLRICREREGRSLCYVGNGGPFFMGLLLAQNPAEKPPRCHSFVCARCHHPLILVHVVWRVKLMSAGPFQILTSHASVRAVRQPAHCPCVRKSIYFCVVSGKKGSQPLPSGHCVCGTAKTHTGKANIFWHVPDNGDQRFDPGCLW